MEQLKQISKEYIKKCIYKEHDIDYFDEIDSTNLYLKRHFHEKSHNSIVIANHQTSGKGRLGRSFISNDGSGIYMSILLKKDYSLNVAKKMTCIACVATSLAIEKVANIKTQIKWVNDIYLNEKKVCGILTEAKINQNIIEYIIIGIGVNLYKQEFDKEVNKIATTLEDETNIVISRNDLIAEIINQMDTLLNSFNSIDIFNEYKKRLFVLNKKATFQIGNIAKEGTIIDINEDYNLVVDFDGRIEEVYSGEITRMRIS